MVSGLESAALGAGKAVMKHMATTWLADRKAEARRGAHLTDLISLRFEGVPLLQRNNLRRKLAEIGDVTGMRLLEVCEREFAHVAQNERLAALEVTDLTPLAEIESLTSLKFATNASWARPDAPGRQETRRCTRCKAEGATAWINSAPRRRSSAYDQAPPRRRSCKEGDDVHRGSPKSSPRSPMTARRSSSGAPVRTRW
jgi:hypothetical protein